MAKVCSACSKELPESEFNKNRNNKDGLQDKCRACFSDYNKKRYEERKDEFKKAIYSYKNDHPEEVLHSRLSAFKKKPTRRNGYRVIEAARNAGALVKSDHCQGCGKSAGDPYRIEAHHHDYTEPLDIIWLCVSCHRGLHAAINRRASLKEATC